jgi:hypothetical protein
LKIREIVIDYTCTWLMGLGEGVVVHRGCYNDQTADADLGRTRSDFLEVLKHRVDHFECLVDLFTDLGTSQDNLSTNEDQEYNLGLDHSVDETRKQLRLVRAEIVMARRKTLQTNGELDVTRADDVLDLEVGELGVETELLNNTSIFS